MANKSLWDLMNENPDFVKELLEKNKTDKELTDIARSTYPDKNIRDEMMRREQQRLASENPPIPEPTPAILKDRGPKPLDEYFPNQYSNKPGSSVEAEKPPVSKYTLPESADFGAVGPESRVVPPSRVSRFVNEATVDFGGPKGFAGIAALTPIAAGIANLDFQNRKKLIENYGLDAAGEGNREVEELQNNPVTDKKISKLQNQFAKQEEDNKENEETPIPLDEENTSEETQEVKNEEEQTEQTPEQQESKLNRKELVDYAASEAAKRGWDVPLVLAHLNQESGFDPNAVSEKGAKGIGQMFPQALETLQQKGLHKDLKFDDLIGPDKGKKQIDTALDYLDWINKYKTKGNQNAAIQWYVDGGDKGGALKAGTDSDAHINNVLANKDKWNQYLSGGQKEDSLTGILGSIKSQKPLAKAVDDQEQPENNRVRNLQMVKDILRGAMPAEEVKASNILDLYKNALLKTDEIDKQALIAKAYSGLTAMNAKAAIKDEMEDYYKEKKKEPVERLMAQLKLDEFDSELNPAHSRAEGFRNFLQSEFNVDPSKIAKMPLKDMEKALSALASYEKSKQLIGQKQIVQDKKDAEKEIQKIKDYMALPEKSGMRTNIGRLYSISNQADKIIGRGNLPGLLPKDQKKWNSITGYNINEMAGAVDSMISMTASVSGREAAAKQMESWWGNLKELASRAGNKALGRDAAGFLKPLYESMIREKRIADDQLHGYYSKIHDSATDKVKTHLPDELKNLNNVYMKPYEVEKKRNQQTIDLVKHYFNSDVFKKKAPDEQTRLKMAKSYVKNLIDSGKIKLNEE
jgi:hypothetical protein